MMCLVATSISVRRTGLLVFLLTAFLPMLAQANSIVPPRNLGELAFMSEAVVLARAGTGTAFGRSGMIFTATDFEVLNVVQGDASEHISVETYGGVLEKTGWQVAGSPTFEPGAVYLLFLNRNGTAWQPRMMAYGLLERVVTDDGTVMLTHIAEHHNLDLVARFDGVEPEPVETYYEQPLLNHLREVASTRVTWNREAAVVPKALQPISHDIGASKSMAIPEPCEYLTYDGYPVRWNTFDDGGSVDIYAQEDGDLDVGSSSITDVQTSINLWKSLSGVNLNYVWAGADSYTPDCSDGSASPNDIAINQGLIQYNDPCDQIPDLSSCSGTLAFGGSFFQIGADGRHEHQGMEWNTSVVAFIIVNNDIGPCLSDTQYRIMITHEMGHTLGFDHIPTSAGTSIMNPTCCNDITPIDETCALFAYSNQTVGQQLGAVALNTPENNANNQPTTLTLDWASLSGADAYHLQVSRTTNFSDLVVDEEGLIQSEDDVSGLEQGRAYFWRVRGISDEFGNGPWSNTFRFTTIFVTPGAVTLREPDNGAIDQPINLTFDWSESTSSPTYQIQVSTNAIFSQIVFEDAELTDTQQTLTLDNGTRYYWRVRGVNPIGQGPWSPTWDLTTLPEQPQAIGLSTPANTAQNQPLALSLSWQPDPSATTYRLQVSRTSTFSDIFFNNNALTETTQEIASLEPGTMYYWRVRGNNTVGSGPWSPVFRFTTAPTPAAIALTFPADNAVDATSTIAFAWEADATAATYHLQVSPFSDFSELVFEDNTLTEPTQTFGPLAYSTWHYWRVRATNDIGTGPWSEVRSFIVAIGTAVERVGEAIPAAYQLHANYPNPFNPTTTLRFDLPASSEVTLSIYDMLGREVETLVAGTLAAGRYTFAWDAADRPSGLYLARLRAGRFVQTQQMLLLK